VTYLLRHVQNAAEHKVADDDGDDDDDGDYSLDEASLTTAVVAVHRLYLLSRRIKSAVRLELK